MQRRELVTVSNGTKTVNLICTGADILMLNDIRVTEVLAVYISVEITGSTCAVVATDKSKIILISTFTIFKKKNIH